MSLDGRSGSMTSSTYMTHIFAFVFLNAIDLSKEGCHNHLDMDSWVNNENLKNLTDTFSLVTTRDPKDTVNCTLEAECLQKGNGIGCYLLEHCLLKTRPQKPSPECTGNSSQVNIYHFMCLMAKAFNHSLKGCEYKLECKTYPETASTPSDLTTTPTTTTTPSTTTPTTTLPETATVLPSPTTATIATLKPTATKLPSESSFTQGNNEAETLRLQDILKETQEETNKLKILLGLSLVLHLIVPLAVYLYMRHRWMRDRMRDRMHLNLTYVSNGNLTGDLPKKESDAPPASLDRDAENTHLLKRDKHSDDAILNCVSGEDQTQL